MSYGWSLELEGWNQLEISIDGRKLLESFGSEIILPTSSSAFERGPDLKFTGGSPLKNQYAEAKWHYITFKTDELTFYAGDIIEVVCCKNNIWWKGKLADKLGWFPRIYVELLVDKNASIYGRTNYVTRIAKQREHAGECDNNSNRISTMLSSSSSSSLSSSSTSCDLARRHVIIDIIKAESDYVKHLDDIVEGFMWKCLENKKLFTSESVDRIFCNIQQIRLFARQFLRELLDHYVEDCIEATCLGKCFIENKKGFELYSDYCINHTSSSYQMAYFNKIKKYREFFEKCRTERAMIEINLDGFLLTPVQKICKYPLQLKQLIRFTSQQHRDYNNLKMAIDIMKNVVSSINEMKREIEQQQQLLRDWQRTIVGWQGFDIMIKNSYLVYSGELIKVSDRGWSHPRVCFVFNKEMIICKKDLLWRNILLFKDRYDLKDITIFSVKDGRDEKTGLNLKTCFKLYLSNKNEHQIWMCKSENHKTEWIKILNELI